ncbi:hypothetical protein [Caballeronia sp. LZ001]|uniref:hypothetical protein n=1 Tax=Caballeronia sp. LZ001 TaxID=3038553 RepID=UPI00285E5552|nr:hypothetical protein [Caballeronia sp. LZ001]MDR5803075.1 hypothetical protein [Caballeronia sp. LZ001]
MVTNVAGLTLIWRRGQVVDAVKRAREYWRMLHRYSSLGVGRASVGRVIGVLQGVRATEAE